MADMTPEQVAEMQNDFAKKQMDENAPNPEAQTELKAANAENERLKLEWEQAKHVNQRQQRDIENNRRSMERLNRQLADSGYQEPEQTTDARMQERFDRQHEEMGMIRYKVENPDWKDTWGDVQKIIQDPTTVEEVAVFDREGKADMFKSLSNAQTRVELQQLRAIKAATEEAKVTKASEQDRLKGQGHISGVTASAGEEEVNVDDMSSDDMIRAGLVDMDPRDPAKQRHPKE